MTMLRMVWRSITTSVVIRGMKSIKPDGFKQTRRLQYMRYSLDKQGCKMAKYDKILQISIAAEPYVLKPEGPNR